MRGRERQNGGELKEKKEISEFNQEEEEEEETKREGKYFVFSVRRVSARWQTTRTPYDVISRERERQNIDFPEEKREEGRREQVKEGRERSSQMY